MLAFGVDSVAQTSLQIGGSSANYGVHDIRGSFVPDPKRISVTSGGTLNASTMGYGAGCRGFITAKPDVIVKYTNPQERLRFFVRAGADTTLLINAADGRWYCNDDASSGGKNPMVNIPNPAAGQYDVWVGSFESGHTIASTLFITELRSEQP